MIIKRSILFVFVLLTIFSCGGKKNRGELIGVRQKKWFPEKPYGMTLIEGGAFIMGKSDEDIAQLNNAAARTVTVPSFYMDETEITNGEYRQFVYWVKDSVTMAMLARKADELELGEDNEDGIGEFDDGRSGKITLGVLIQDGIIEAGDGVMAVDYAPVRL